MHEPELPNTSGYIRRCAPGLRISAVALPLLVVLVALVVGALFVWWLLMLLEALRTPNPRWEAAGQSQLVYILLMAVTGLIGTIAYVAVARPKLR